MRAGTALLLLHSVLAVTGCGLPTSPSLPPCDVFDVYGTTTDDASLAPGRVPSTPIGGASVTIVSGPGAGTTVIAAQNGNFAFQDLRQAGERVLEASAPGYETIRETFYFGGIGNSRSTRCTRATSIEMGQEPHIVWGDVQQAGSPGFIPGARVEILDGANAGAVAFTDETSTFRIDGQRTSGVFHMRISADGYETRIDQFESLRRNSHLQLRLFRQ